MTQRTRSIAAAAAVLAVLTVGITIGTVTAQSGDDNNVTPANDSADAGFVRDMSTHHAQAVSMADAIRTRTKDPILASFATDIVLTQQSQIGRFSGWLDQWGLPVTSTDAPMSWAQGHTTMDMETMPGMTTRDEVRQIANSIVASPQSEIEAMRSMLEGGTPT